VAAAPGSSGGIGPLTKVIKDGLRVPEAQIMFALNPFSITVDGKEERASASWHELRISIDDSRSEGWSVTGDVVIAPAYCLDLAVWKLGGAAIPLRLVQLANVSAALKL
jgi:hypothetical protein